jgi:UDP-glucuronate 4-epimerase
MFYRVRIGDLEMHILVTGGAGFIGSHLVEKLLHENHQVTVIDNFDPFYPREIKQKNLDAVRHFKKFDFHEIDIQDRFALEVLFGNTRFDFIVHLAAKAGVRPSIADPQGYYRTNVEGTINLLECCRKSGVNKFILASTSSIYGNTNKVPFCEDDPVDRPVSPYGASKKAAELICHTYHHLYKIKIHALRFFTVYGPRQRPDLAIHKFFDLVMHDQPLPLYGDGSTSRDYTYIDDIIAGIMKSMERIDGYEIINLGNSRSISLMELVRLIGEVTGKTIKKEYFPMQAGDVITTSADISKAQKMLDYRPATRLEDGLKVFLEWYQQDRPNVH